MAMVFLAMIIVDIDFGEKLQLFSFLRQSLIEGLV